MDKETKNRIRELQNRTDRLNEFVGQEKKKTEEEDYSIGVGTGIMSFFTLFLAIALLLINTNALLILSGGLFTVSAILIITTVGCIVGYIRTRLRIKQQIETKKIIKEVLSENRLDCPQCPFLYTAECKQHHENADCEEAVAELRGEE